MAWRWVFVDRDTLITFVRIAFADALGGNAICINWYLALVSVPIDFIPTTRSIRFTPVWFSCVTYFDQFSIVTTDFEALGNGKV